MEGGGCAFSFFSVLIGACLRVDVHMKHQDSWILRAKRVTNAFSLIIYHIKSLGDIAQHSSLLLSHEIRLKCTEVEVDVLFGLVLPN